MDAIRMGYFVDPENITEIDSMFNGEEYICRVLLREGDKQWGVWMTTPAQRLGPVLFPKEPA